MTVIGINAVQPTLKSVLQQLQRAALVSLFLAWDIFLWGLPKLNILVTLT